jgi:hypothetical protein
MAQIDSPVNSLPTPPDPNWWVGKQLTCPSCGCIFTMQSHDYVYNIRYNILKNQGQFTTNCPHCNTVSLYNDVIQYHLVPIGVIHTT